MTEPLRQKLDEITKKTKPYRIFKPLILKKIFFSIAPIPLSESEYIRISMKKKFERIAEIWYIFRKYHGTDWGGSRGQKMMNRIN